MPSVDNRVVRMEFDNRAFERNLSTTLRSLADLEKALKFEGAGRGLAEVSSAAQHMNLGTIASAVDHIASRFTALGAVAFTVIQNLTTSALGFVKQVGGNLIDSVMGRGKQRALNIEQAKFLFAGLGADVEKSMDSARRAVLGTAYGLDVAAKAAAQFGASGIDAGEEMYKSLRGVAGVSAMTGSSFEEMADVFTQAAGQGKISGYTLQRISMRGLNAAAALAKQMGKTEAEIRDMASEGKISFKEFALAMDDAFGAHAQEANKTYEGSLANLHAAMGRLGAAIQGPQLEQQRDLFNAITPKVDALKEALQPLIDMFVFLRRLGINALIKQIGGISFEGITKAAPTINKAMANLFLGFSNIVKVGKEAFREIIPIDTVGIIQKVANAFLKFSEAIKMGAPTLEKIKTIFKGWFSILSIGWSIVANLVKFIWGLAQSLLGLSDGKILDFFVKISEFFIGLQEQLVKGKGIQDFFKDLGTFIKEPIKYIKDFKDAFIALFTGVDPSLPEGVSKSMGRVSDRFEHLRGLLERAGDIWRPFGNALEKIMGVLDKIWSAISDWFSELGQKMAAVMEKGDFDAVIDALNATLLGGITAILVKFMRGGGKIGLDLSGGMFDSIIATFEELTGVLEGMQLKLKADALMRIAAAIAILTASVVVLAMIDSVALTKALTAMAVGFGQLIGVFAAITQLSGPKGAAKFTLISGGMIALSTAILILSGAMKVLGTMDWGEILRGLVAMAGMLVILIALSKLLTKAAPGLILGGIGVGVMGTGLTILAGAVAIFGNMELKTIGIGLLGIAGALLVIAGAMQLMPATLPITGAGLILVGIGLNILAGALKLMSGLSWSEMAKGFAGIGGGLLIIAGAMHLMPMTLPITAAGLILVGIALGEIAAAMLIFGGMDWGEIGKGLAAMAGALLILAIATNAMTGALAGAAAILVVSFSLTILAGVIKTMAELSWGDLIKGIAGIAIAFGVLGLAALVLEPVIPAMLGLGAALLLIGAGFAVFGVGALLVARALQAIAESGAKAAKAIPEILEAIGKSLGAVGRGIAEGLIEMVKTFTDAAPVIMKALGVLLSHILDTLIELIPKIKEVAILYIGALIEIIREKVPDLIEAGLHILMSLLQGIRDNIGEITTMVADIIINFIDALTAKVPEMVDSVYNLLLTVIEAVLVKLQQLPKDMFMVVGRAFMSGIFGGILQKAVEVAAWLGSLGLKVIQWIGNVARTLWNKGKDFIGGLLGGIVERAIAVMQWYVTLPFKVLGWIGNVARTLWNKGMDFIGGILGGILQKWHEVYTWVSGIGQRVKDAIGDLTGKLKSVGGDLIGGLLQGVKDGWDKLTGWISSAADKLPGPVKKLFGIGSPSKVFMEIGSQLMDGFYIGVKDGWEDVEKLLVEAAREMSMMEDFNPTITPVLDLTQVAADAAKIAEYISPAPAVAVSDARNLAAATNVLKAPSDSTTAVAAPGVTFTQVINAPEQLSTADIYKQTRNQITLAKEELSIP